MVHEVKEVFDDIKTTRKIEDVPNFWKYIANDPDTLENLEFYETSDEERCLR